MQCQEKRCSLPLHHDTHLSIVCVCMCHQEEESSWGEPPTPVGLPFDWHLPPRVSNPTHAKLPPPSPKHLHPSAARLMPPHSPYADICASMSKVEGGDVLGVSAPSGPPDYFW